MATARSAAAPRPRRAPASRSVSCRSARPTTSPARWSFPTSSPRRSSSPPRRLERGPRPRSRRRAPVRQRRQRRSLAGRRARGPRAQAAARPPRLPVGALRAGLRTDPIACRVVCDGDELFEGKAWQVIVACTGRLRRRLRGRGRSRTTASSTSSSIEGSSRARLVHRAYGMRAGRDRGPVGSRHRRRARGQRRHRRRHRLQRRRRGAHRRSSFISRSSRAPSRWWSADEPRAARPAPRSAAPSARRAGMEARLAQVPADGADRAPRPSAGMPPTACATAARAPSATRSSPTSRSTRRTSCARPRP